MAVSTAMICVADPCASVQLGVSANGSVQFCSGSVETHLFSFKSSTRVVFVVVPVAVATSAIAVFSSAQAGLCNGKVQLQAFSWNDPCHGPCGSF
eukprot:scaffold144514_cov19-Tisochrysis_lutea.AAC.1